jgi:hypothetical protein
MSVDNVWLLETCENYELNIEGIYLNQADAETDRKIFGKEYTIHKYALRDKPLAHRVTYVRTYLLPTPDTDYRVDVETSDEDPAWTVIITDKLDGRNVDRGVAVRLVGDDIKRAFEIAHKRVEEIKAREAENQ